jgi:hypothetical protein
MSLPHPAPVPRRRRRRRGVLATALLGLLASVATLGGGGAHASGGSLPAARHVWLIDLENKGYDETFGGATNPYLASVLPGQGALLRQYYGIGHVSLDNYIAQLSGQAPNADTQSDCQNYQDVAPGTPTSGGQVVGQGCVYPTSVQTLPNQLTAAGLTYKGYMEDMGNDAGREPSTCGNPGPAGPTPVRDPTQTSTATDQYAARHNPFVYFHSLLDDGQCAARVHRLDELPSDLGSAATTPNFSFITPNLCNDGHDDPCTGVNTEGTHAGGLVGSDAFLRHWVPLITGSPAFRDGGVLVVTFDESDGNGGTSALACCGEPTGPNTTMPGTTGPGGGRVGAVVLSPFVRPGTVSDVPYNHYSLLRSLEDLLGISTGGADGKGHLGYAGQDGLVPFGADVFTQPAAAGASPAPTAAAAAAAAGPASLSMRLSRATAVFHDPLRATGRLLDSRGAPVAGAQVLLSCAGSRGSGSTDAAGRFTIDVRAAASGACVATAAGLRSTDTRLDVAWLSTVTGSARSLLTGSVAPAHAGVTVIVRDGSRKVGSARTVASGRWHLRLPTLRTGTHRLAVTVVPSRSLRARTTVRSVRVVHAA